MKNSKSIFFILMLFLANSAFSQDFHLSQYDVAALNTNPALTGMFAGKHRFHLHYRNQWAAVSTRPFTTIQASWDMRLNTKWSVGVQFMNYHAGSSSYNTAEILPSVSYSIPLTKDKFHRLTLGVAAGVFNKSFSQRALTWGTQYEVTPNGGHFNSGISSGEHFENTNIFRPDFNAGLIYFYGKPGAKVSPFLGFSIFHLNRPKESFLGGKKNRLPLRYLVHAGVRIGINKKLSVVPKIYWQMQERAMEITLSGIVYYYIESSNFYLIGGLTYRSQDAAILEVGGKWKGWDLRISYDFNVSSLTPVSHSRGAAELSLTYILSHKKEKIKMDLIQVCPRL